LGDSRRKFIQVRRTIRILRRRGGRLKMAIKEEVRNTRVAFFI